MKKIKAFIRSKICVEEATYVWEKQNTFGGARGRAQSELRAIGAT